MPSTHLSLNYHIVFSTKNREPILAASWRADLHAYLGGTVRDLGGVAQRVGGVADHVHFLAALKATHKPATSIWFRKNKVCGPAATRSTWWAPGSQNGQVLHRGHHGRDMREQVRS